MRRRHRQDGRAKHLSLTESRPTLPGRKILPLVLRCLPGRVYLRKSDDTVAKIVWARTAKKSAKPEEPKIEDKKSERHCHDDAARGRPEQDQRADFQRVLRIVVNFDLITGLHHGHAHLAAAALPSISLSID